MQAVIFDPQNQLRNASISIQKIENIFSQIADTSDTDHLVTAVYFLPGRYEIRGAYLRHWVNTAHFTTSRGKWAFTGHLHVPAGMPAKFRLIRMRLDGRADLYPREDRDTYGWAFSYQTLEDHLALLFAHELHHYRRYHLNLHTREGEQGANRWALARAVAKGYQVTGRRVIKSTSKKRKKRIFHLIDPYRNYRGLKSGDRLTVQVDPTGCYLDQHVHVVRPVRSNSKRIVIETADGKQWRWPMTWLKVDDNK